MRLEVWYVSEQFRIEGEEEAPVTANKGGWRELWVDLRLVDSGRAERRLKSRVNDAGVPEAESR
jgi:hypothetical protein